MAAQCGKECFPDKNDAKTKARAMERAGKKQQDVYFCSRCQAWHTTRLKLKKFYDACPQYDPKRKRKSN